MPGQRVGYIRVGTVEQNADPQLDGVPVERTFVDRASGSDTDRPELESMLQFVRAGDSVVVHSMDRLARNLGDLRHLVELLTARGVSVEFVKEHLAFTGEDSPIATLMLSVMPDQSDQLSDSWCSPPSPARPWGWSSVLWWTSAGSTSSSLWGTPPTGSSPMAAVPRFSTTSTTVVVAMGSLLSCGNSGLGRDRR